MDENILSISLIEYGSTNDFFLMLHYLNKLVFYDPRLEKSVYQIPKNLHPRNVIEFRRSISISDFHKESTQSMFISVVIFLLLKDHYINLNLNLETGFGLF